MTNSARRAAQVAAAAAAPVMLSGAAPASPSIAAGDFAVHVVTLPTAAFANALVVETAGHVVVIDAGFSPDHAAAITEVVASTGKPIEAVLITHAHIDHYGGLVALERGDAPVVTGAGVARQIEAFDGINYARFGLTPPPGQRGPDRTLGHGQSIEVDGVRFTLNEAGPGESYSDVWYMIEGADGLSAAALGDLVMFGIPPFAQSGHTGEWLGALKAVHAAIPEATPLYLGHDLRGMQQKNPHADHAMIEWQAARVQAFRDAVAASTDRARLLTADEIGGVVEAMHADAPENLADFDFLITTTANIVAAELILEREKEQFEAQLQAVLANMMSQGAETGSD